MRSDPDLPNRYLGMDNLINNFTSNPDHQKEVRKVLNTLCQDLPVIRYRQEVLTDLLCHPQLAGLLEALLPTIDALGRHSHRVVEDITTLHEFTWRMGELQGIVDCIQGMGAVFQEIGDSLGSQGFSFLRDQIAAIQADPDFIRFSGKAANIADKAARLCQHYHRGKS